jgi:mercuric ion transport protein
MSTAVDQSNQQRTLSWITLLASAGTLLCCALPILMVSLGFGAVVATLTSSLPALVTLAEYEPWMFSVSALLLGITAWVLWFRPQQCPSDPALAERCAKAGAWNRKVFWMAAVVWVVGFTATYLLLPIRNFMGV